MQENTTKPREIQLPFAGFYYSIWSDAVDHHDEQTAEWYEEREWETAREAVIEREKAQLTLPFADRAKVEVDESQIVTKAEFAELFLEHTDYSKVYEQIAKFYVEAFSEWAHDELELPANSLGWAAMSSPREYNFTTDRVFATVTEEFIQAMWERSVKDEHETLAEVLKDRHTSYDGFLSFYSNDLDEWLAKPLAEWDHNELGSLLIAVLRLADIELDRGDRLDHLLYEHVFSGNGEEDEAWDKGMNWEAYEKDLAALREKKKFAEVAA